MARGVEDGFGDGVQQKKQSFLATALAVALPGRRVVLVIRLRFRIPIIFAVVVLGLLVIPQTIFRLRGSGGVGKKGLWILCGSQTSVFTWFGEGHSRLVQAKWSILIEMSYFS